MGYDRMEQEKSPTEMMYGLTRAFYEEKDAEKIVAFMIRKPSAGLE